MMPFTFSFHYDGCNCNFSFDPAGIDYQTPPRGWLDRGMCPEMMPDMYYCEKCAEAFFKKRPMLREKVEKRRQLEEKRRQQRRIRDARE